MKFTVYIKETNYGVTEVEAESAEEAVKLAEDSFFNGNVQWESVRLECDDKPFEGSGLDE